MVTWDLFQPKTGSVTYHGGGQEAQEVMLKYSDNIWNKTETEAGKVSGITLGQHT